MRPINDHYGAALAVEAVREPYGWMVDLEKVVTLEGGLETEMDFSRLTPDDARILAAQLAIAADKAEEGL